MLTFFERLLKKVQVAPSPPKVLSPDGTDVAVARHHFEIALLDALATTPNVISYMLVIVGPSAFLTYGQVNFFYQMVWVGVAIAIGAVIEIKTRQFAKLSQTQRDQNRESWIQIAEFGPSIFGLVYCTYLLSTFSFLDHQSQVYLTLIGVGLLTGSMGHFALTTRTQTVLTITSMTLVWLIWGESTERYVVIGWSAFGYFGFLKGRRFQANAAIQRVVLVEQTQRLSDELLQRNAQLEQLNREKNFLLASASHDLRQPVHALGLLLANWHPEGTHQYHRQRIEVARSRVDLLSHMLKSVLDVTQLELGVYPTEILQFDMHALLEEIFQEYAEPARHKGLQMQLDVSAAQGIEITSDPGLLGRILGNLLSNAVKYTQHGHVLLRAEMRPSNALCITVEDSGAGIEPQHQANIFRSYARMESAKSTSSGMGIGLSIVQQGTRLLNLELSLDSQAGQGSKFSLHIPSNKLRHRDASKLPESQPHNLQGARIAVVDDDEIICSATVELLESWGCIVFAAYGIGELIERIESSPSKPDLLIADYQLEAGNTGVDCIHAVRTMLQQPGLPAILLTGDVLIPFPEGFSESCTQLMHKPLSAGRLRESLITMLRHKRPQ